MVVRINGVTKKRVVSLIRKCPPVRIPKQHSLNDRMSSLSNIDIKKNASEHTEGHSDNRIESSMSIDPPSAKHYLTIGRIGAAAQPKILELLPTTSLSTAKDTCSLEWEEVKDSIYENCPKLVELKFTDEEVLEVFVRSFQRVKEEMR